MMQGLATAVLTALLLTACGTIEKEKKSQTLHDATRYYEYALRWSDYESANKLRNPASLVASPEPASLEKKLIDRQKWIFAQDAEIWYLDGPLPSFK
jgi:hypothetical protein